MQILNIRPARLGNNVRAFLDVRFDNGMSVRDMRLVQTANGLRVYGPEMRGRSPVSIPTAVADEISKMAVAQNAA